MLENPYWKSVHKKLFGSDSKMVNVKKFLTTKYLTGKYLDENTEEKERINHKPFVIDAVFVESIGQPGKEQEKLAVRFKNIDMPMPLNQTNITILSASFGDNTDNWVNEKVIINLVNKTFQGNPTKGIDLEPVTGGKKKKTEEE
jgi:hypothetical protein